MSTGIVWVAAPNPFSGALMSSASPHEWLEGVSVSVPSGRLIGRQAAPQHQPGCRLM